MSICDLELVLNETGYFCWFEVQKAELIVAFFNFAVANPGHSTPSSSCIELMFMLHITLIHAKSFVRGMSKRNVGLAARNFAF